MEQINDFETQNLNPVTPPKNIFKILFFILLALVLVITSVLTTLLITKDKSITPVQELTTIPSPTVIPTQTIVDETADWKTYTDPTYKYSLKYPSDLVLTKESTNSIMIETAEIMADIKNKRPQELMGWSKFIEITAYNSISEIVGNSSNIKTLENLIKEEEYVDEITIDGIKGYLCTSNYPSKHILIQKGNIIYRIDFDMFQEDDTNQQQIINSFKFN